MVRGCSLTRYHNNIVERILPHCTKRREVYDLGLKSCRILVKEGFGDLLWHYNERKRVKTFEEVLGRETSLVGFCAAPWLEGVLHNNGSLTTCCRNGTCFGNWQKDGLKNCWHSQPFQEFRKIIKNGEFPDVQCFNCYHNGTSRPLASELDAPFREKLDIIIRYLGTNVQEIADIEPLFILKELNTDTNNVLDRYFSSIAELEKRSQLYPSEFRLALVKLNTIGSITKAFLEGNLVPPSVVPFRQPQLITKCNARCIMCSGRYTGSIINGFSLDEKYLDEAFSQKEDIINFFMNGSEFLYYENWKMIAELLVNNGIKLTISTNSILLTPSTIEFLIDNKIMQNLNISIDGASKETIESIRLGVKYDQLINNISFLFSYASKKRYEFNLAISFVLMRRNYRELPKLIEVINSIKNGNKYPSTINITCQALEAFDIEGYRDFVLEEHHSMIAEDDLLSVFKEALKVSEATHIPVIMFYTFKLEDIISSIHKMPPLMIK